ncbi:MAG TPA: TlpA disulfide reductase family protein, partial [Leptolinea sp.]
MKIFRKSTYIAIGILILVLIGANILMSRSEQDESIPLENIFASLPSKPKNGSVVPDFSLNDLTGNSISISQYRGKPVVLNFWATWCGPCLVEMPLLETVSVRHKDDLVVVGLNIAESTKRVDSFVKTNKITFPILLDVNGLVADTFKAYAYPATIFI